jgi:quercetin dioxygenase-like cupin family protein
MSTPVIRPRETSGFWFLGTEMRMLASGEQTGRALGLIEQVAPAGFAAPPHIHHGEDEAFYVVSGAATFHSGESVIEAEPGTFIWLPRDVAHWFEVASTGPARLLQFNTPGGLERFFEELGTPMTGSPRAPSAPPDMETLARMAARYRIDLLPSAGA